MTELKLEFQLENPELPVDLDKVILSFLKASIENYSQDLFEKLYNKRQSVVKMCCWSCYLPQAQFASDRIRLGMNKFTINFINSIWTIFIVIKEEIFSYFLMCI